MARPNGTRSIRGWTMTPQQQVEAGVLSPNDVRINEVVQSDGVRVVRIEALEGARRDWSKVEGAFPQKNRQSPQGLSSSLAKAENRLRRNSYESMVILDKKGAVVSEITQRNASVTLTSEQRAIAKNKIVTHNHPGKAEHKPTEKKIGISLSEEDLYFASINQTKEMRAVAHTGTVYSLKRNKNVPGIDERSRKEWTDNIYNRAWENAKAKVINRLEVGRLTREEIASLSNHFVNREFARLSNGVFSYKTQSSGKIAKEIERYDRIYDQD